jgi:hypothetical protein
LPLGHSPAFLCLTYARLFIFTFGCRSHRNEVPTHVCVCVCVCCVVCVCVCVCHFLTHLPARPINRQGPVTTLGIGVLLSTVGYMAMWAGAKGYIPGDGA